jgi:hypothetical protein
LCVNRSNLCPQRPCGIALLVTVERLAVGTAATIPVDAFRVTLLPIDGPVTLPRPVPIRIIVALVSGSNVRFRNQHLCTMDVHVRRFFLLL